jgi:putative peptidoglycan lipid II flippase
VYDLLVVGAGSFAVKLLGAGKSAFSARAFGIGRELDCYLIAFSLATLVCETAAGSLTPALIPALAKARASVGIDQIRHAYGRILYSGCGALVVLAVLVTLSDRLAFRFLASGFSPQDLLMTHRILLLLLPMFPATAITAVWRALLNGDGFYALPACAPGLTPVLATLFVFAKVAPGGIYAFALGTSAGALAEVVILAIAIRRSNYAVLPGLAFRLRSGWLRHEYLPMLATNFIGGSRTALDQAVAATLGPGGISALALGTRFVSVAISIGPAAIGTVLLPRLSRFTATGDAKSLRKLVGSTVLVGCSLGCVASILGIALSEPITYVAFQKGSQRAIDLHLLVQVQTLSFTQLPFAVIAATLGRVALAARLNRSLLLISVMGAISNLALDVVCSRHMGVAGIALASTLSLALTAAMLLIAAWRSDLLAGRTEPRCPVTTKHSAFY